MTIDDDSVLDEKLKKSLSNNSKWNGSPDKLWHKIEIKTRKPVFLHRKIRLWAAVAAALLVIAGMLYYKPWLETFQASRGNVLDRNGNADSVNINTGTQSKGYDSPTAKHPAPHYVDFSINPLIMQVNPGQKFDVQVNFTSRTDSLNFCGTPPVIRMWKWGSAWDKPLQEVTVASLLVKDSAVKTQGPDNNSGTTVSFDAPMKQGLTASSTVQFEAPLNPGWYSFDMMFKIKSGSTISTISGNAVKFFVKYPEGSTRNGSFTINRSVTNASHTVKLNGIAMSDDETKIEFEISNTPVPAGFAVNLISSSGMVIPALEESEKGLDNGNIVYAVFGPVLKSSSKLTFEVKDIDEITKDGIKANPGPWVIEIPLE